MNDALPIPAGTPGLARPDLTTTRPLREALRGHFVRPNVDFPGGVFLTEVQAPNSPTVRYADAVWVNFTSTPGIGIDVCEIKVTRADLNVELADPTKADAWWPYSSRFWIVSPSPAVTPPELLPDGWGLMCPKPSGRRFKVIREPSVRTPMVSLELLVTLLKKIDTGRPAMIRDAVHAAETALHRRFADERERQAEGLSPQARKRLELLDGLESALGVELAEFSSEWGWPPRVEPGELAEAVKLALAVVRGEDKAVQRMRRLTEDAERMKTTFDRAVDELRAVTGPIADLQSLAQRRLERRARLRTQP